MQKKKPKSSQTKSKANLFGFHTVREAWLNPEREIRALYLTKQSQNSFDSVLHEAQKKGLQRPDPLIIEKSQLDKLLPQGAVHQGIAISAAPLPEIFLQDLIIKAEHQKKSVILVLDQITDPHNVGAIIRSACAFQATGIVVQTKHAPDLTGVLAKSASGAVEHVPVVHETNLSRSVETLKENGFFAYGLDERGKQTIDQLVANNPPEKIALVLGAEGPGIRQLIKTHCDELLRLPMEGAIPSLNVSNAAAVALYALFTSKT